MWRIRSSIALEDDTTRDRSRRRYRVAQIAIARQEPFPATAAFKIQQSEEIVVIRKLTSGEYRLYSRKKNPKTNKRRNLGTFKTRAAAEEHERAVQYYKHHG
jgi:hypothetical protein